MPSLKEKARTVTNLSERPQAGILELQNFVYHHRIVQPIHLDHLSFLNAGEEP